MLLGFILSCGFLFYADGAVKLKEVRLPEWPPHITLDPFKECLDETGGLYCSGYLTYVIDEPSALFNILQDHSAHTAKHFNRTKTYYGICVSQQCKDVYSEGETTQDLRWVLEACLNKSVWEKYNLKVKLENNMYCQKHGDNNKIDTADAVYIMVVISLLLLNIIGSLLDIYALEKQPTPATNILLCFSIPRNWTKLKAMPTKLDTKQRFKFFYGYRAILTMSIIIVHSVIPLCYTNNPDYLEKQYSTYYAYVFINGHLFMQIFLVMSGFLLVYNSEKAEIKSITWKWFLEAIARRWLRLTAPYAVVLGFVATLFRLFGEGPLWNELVSSETEDCRRYWWWHLVYLNTYIEDSTCMTISWYIATDFQLHCLGLLIFIICHKSKYRNVILSSTVIIGMMISAINTYVKDLDGIFIASPSTLAGKFITNRTFVETYTRGHCNIPSFIIGMYTGYLVHRLQKNGFNIAKYRKWRYVIPYWAQMALQFSVVIYCRALFEGPTPTLIVRSLMAAFIKPLFGLTQAVTFLGMTFKLEKFSRYIYEWRGWTVLGRVSLASVLLHCILIDIFAGNITTASTATQTNVIIYGIGFQVVTYLLACVFWMTVETPLAQVINLIMSGSKDQHECNDRHQKNGKDVKLKTC